jgi:gliding motility-associated-like protein
MASTCAAACIVCDLDGFSSFNEGTGGGQLPPGFCTFTLHRAEWVGFIAGSTNLSFQLSVFNCTNNNGLEAGIYRGTNCQNFSLISNCETQIFNNTTVTMTTNVPLVIGQYYWLVMDSNGGPACNFSINVTAGSTDVPPPSPIPAINGPNAICPGLTANYSIAQVPGGPNVSWQVNNQPAGNGLSLNYQFPSAGNYQVCVAASNPCNPPVSLCSTVVVENIPSTTVTEAICLGECFQAPDGTSFCSPGVYPIVFDNWQGCDSVVNYSIQVIQPPTTLLGLTICEGESVMVGPESFSSPGTYTVFLSNWQGCDSVVTLTLENYTPIVENYSASICESESYILGNVVYDQTGMYQQVFSNWLGCDSTVNLDLTVTPEDSVYLSQTICQGESYQVGTQSFNMAGNYTAVLESAAGCDSTVFLDLEVNPNPTTNLSIQICQGQTYSTGNQVFSSSGDYQVVLASSTGCDSTIHLALDVLPTVTTTLNQQVCQGESYAVGTQSFDQTGQYQVTLASATGCDSTVLLNLSVLPSLQTTLDLTVCPGESVQVGAQSFNQTGQYQVTLASATGCDSTILLDLVVATNPTTVLNEAICQGQTVQVGGQSFGQSGSYQVVLPAANGCDSTVTLNLSISPGPTTLLTRSICQGSTYDVGNQSFAQTGVYQVVLPTANGCDSLVTLDLAVLPSPITNRSATICEGESYTIGNQVFALSGNYSVVLNTAQGCDSTVNLALTVTPVPTNNLIAQICEGDIYTVGNQQFTQAGMYQVVLQAASNCDSIVNLNLSVTNCGVVASLAASPVNCNGGSDGSLAFTINNGTPPFSYDWGGAGLPSGNGMVAALGTQTILPDLPAGTYTVTVTGADGFAGTFSATVTQPSALVSVLVASQIGNYNLPCLGDQNGSVSCNTSGGTPPYQFAWDMGQSSPDLTGLPAGSYALTVTDAHDCQLELMANLLEPPAIVWEIETTEPTCTEPLGSISVAAVSGGVQPYLFALEGGGFAPQNIFEGLATGSYTLVGQDANGCQIATTVSLQGFEAVQVSLGADLTVELGEAVTLVPVSNTLNLQYAWQGDWLSCTDCESPKVQPLADGVYTLTVTTPDGCSATDELTIHVQKDRSVYVPNAFSPNDDGINDVLMVFAGPDVAKVRSFLVFSRWGESMFTYFNIPPNEVAYGWDGRYRGKEMQPAVFTWFAEVEFLDGEVVLFKGDVAIVR